MNTNKFVRDEKREALETRRKSFNNVVSKLSLDPTIIPSSFQEIIYDDYFSGKKLRPKKSLRFVIEDIKKYHRFRLSNKKDEPFIFLMFVEDEENFEENYKKWLVYCEKRDFVFSQEWHLVSQYLTKHEVMMMRRASPVFTMSRIQRFHCYKECLDTSLSQFPAWKNKQSYIFQQGYGDVKERVSIIFKGRFNDEQPMETITNMFAFVFNKIHDLPIRRMNLIQELKKYGLVLREDSCFCHEYIYNKTSASIDEVVAITRITSFLFENGGHRIWSLNRTRLETHMKEGMNSGRYKNWHDACSGAMDLELERYDYDYDYNHHYYYNDDSLSEDSDFDDAYISSSDDDY